MQLLEMPVNGYYFFLKSIPCEEPLLQPRHTVRGDNAAEEYGKARDMWLQQGWAELDFDGTLRVFQDFGRLQYDLTHMDAVLRWERPSATEYFIKGPVDLLHAVEAGGTVRLAREKNVFLLRYLRQGDDKKLEGTLAVKRMSDGKTKSGALSLTAEETEPDDLTEYLALFYGEGNDA